MKRFINLSVLLAAMTVISGLAFSTPAQANDHHWRQEVAAHRRWERQCAANQYVAPIGYYPANPYYVNPNNLSFAQRMRMF